MINEATMNNEEVNMKSLVEEKTVKIENNKEQEQRYNPRPWTHRATIAKANLVEVLPSFYDETIKSEDSEMDRCDDWGTFLTWYMPIGFLEPGTFLRTGNFGTCRQRNRDFSFLYILLVLSVLANCCSMLI